MKKMKPTKKRTVKGMTLIEIIISMLIFTLLASIMVRVGAVTKSLMMNTNHLNNKTSAESTIGAVQDVSALTSTANAHYSTPQEAADAISETDLQITVSGSGFSATVDAKKYSTKAAADNATASGRNCDTSDHMNGDLQFYVIQP